MPLTADDKSKLYSQAFQANARQLMGEQAHVGVDLKTQLDVLNYELGVAKDEIAALQKEVADLKAKAEPLPEQRA